MNFFKGIVEQWKADYEKMDTLEALVLGILTLLLFPVAVFDLLK